MRLGLIAAGEGARLKQEGIMGPKGLVPVAGVPMARRTIDAFVRCGIARVCCIVNEESTALADYLRSEDFGVPVELLVRSTPSSMHSLFALAPMLDGEPFFLATVDAVYRSEQLEAYVREASRRTGEAHGTLAVTSHIDDESPLYVRMDADRRITAVGEEARGSEWISGGLYHFSDEVFNEIPTAGERGIERLRNFQALLVERGYHLFGHPFGLIVDVDHRSDIEKAEAYLAGDLASNLAVGSLAADGLSGDGVSTDGVSANSLAGEG